MFRNRSKRFWITLIVLVAVIVFYLPSLVAFHYTASSQRTSFLTHPWRSWAFAWTALTVPGNSTLKTSGEALRAADSMFNGSAVDPHAVRLLFLDEGDPYTFTHSVAGRDMTTTVTPPYRFVWQVTGSVDTGAPEPSPDTVVALLDYRTGQVLYDVRRDLATTLPVPLPSASPTPTGSPST